MRDRFTCKIATHDDDRWNEVVFGAIIKHFPETGKRLGMVEPDIREEEKVKFGELFTDACCKL